MVFSNTVWNSKISCIFPSFKKKNCILSHITKKVKAVQYLQNCFSQRSLSNKKLWARFRKKVYRYRYFFRQEVMQKLPVYMLNGVYICTTDFRILNQFWRIRSCYLLSAQESYVESRGRKSLKFFLGHPVYSHHHHQNKNFISYVEKCLKKYWI